MFAPWRSQKSVRKHKDPMTGNSLINFLTEWDGIVHAGNTTSQTSEPWTSITRAQRLSFLSLSSDKKKKSEGCDHSIVQSVKFVLFGSRVFSIRWQGLRVIKYKMDSRPQIVYLYERHTCKYVRKPWACSFNFSPFWHQLPDLSYQ